MTKKYTVLVIDDDPLNIVTLSQILSDEFTVLAGKGGINGIETAKNMLPDIILLDVVMPDMNGFEVITALKTDDYTKNIPIIFVTANDNLQSEEQGLYLGAADYINKPFTSRIVKLRIRNQLRIIEQLKLIQELTVPDPLSGVFAPKYFNSILDEELHRAARTKTTMGFIIFNMDNFQAYSDERGYELGDDLLRRLTGVIANRVTSPGNKAVRWGDDEFVIMLPGTNFDDTLKIAEDVRKLIQVYSSSISQTNEEITASAGVHVAAPVLNEKYLLDFTVDQLIAETLEALAEAKATDKNKVSVAPNATDIPEVNPLFELEENYTWLI